MLQAEGGVGSSGVPGFIIFVSGIRESRYFPENRSGVCDSPIHISKIQESRIFHIGIEIQGLFCGEFDNHAIFCEILTSLRGSGNDKNIFWESWLDTPPSFPPCPSLLGKCNPLLSIIKYKSAFPKVNVNIFFF